MQRLMFSVTHIRGHVLESFSNYHTAEVFRKNVIYAYVERNKVAVAVAAAMFRVVPTKVAMSSSLI